MGDKVKKKFAFPPPPRSFGFTLIEMLTTVAVLIILLGMMVSLARYVRDRSAQQLTRDLLRKIDVLMAQYVERNEGKWPNVGLILTDVAATLPSRSVLADAAVRNNVQWVKVLQTDHDQRLPDQEDQGPFHDQPFSIYDAKSRTLRDAWGSPVVFMSRQHPLIGLAPSRSGRDQFFFFSAGPDRDYLTREDNLYSYETSEGTSR